MELGLPAVDFGTIDKLVELDFFDFQQYTESRWHLFPWQLLAPPELMRKVLLVR